MERAVNAYPAPRHLGRSQPRHRSLQPKHCLCHKHNCLGHPHRGWPRKKGVNVLSSPVFF